MSVFLDSDGKLPVESLKMRSELRLQHVSAVPNSTFFSARTSLRPTFAIPTLSRPLLNQRFLFSSTEEFLTTFLVMVHFVVCRNMAKPSTDPSINLSHGLNINHFPLIWNLVFRISYTKRVLRFRVCFTLNVAFFSTSIHRQSAI